MALDFSSSTHQVDYGTGAAFANLSTLTVCAWVWVDSSATSEHRLYTKGYVGAHGTYDFLGYNAGNWQWDRRRATTSCYAEASAANYAAGGTNKWLFVAAGRDLNGVDADQYILLGDLSRIAAGPSAYANQRVGLGAAQNDSTAPVIIGQRGGNALNWDGRIAWVGIWNRRLTHAEVAQQQFRPHLSSGCLLFAHLGYNGTGTQADWSGNASSGTVTGATLADHVPIMPSFGMAASLPYVVVGGGGNQYDESVSLVAVAATGLGGQLEALSALSLSGSAAMANQSQGVLGESVGFVVGAALASADTLLASGSLDLTAAADVARAGSVVASEILSLQALAAAGTDSNVVADDGLVLGALAALSATTGASAYDESIALSATATTEAIAGLVAQQAVALASAAALPIVGGILLDSEILLPVSAAVENAVGAVLSAELNLPVVVSVVVGPHLTAGNTVAMGVVASFTVAGEGGEAESAIIVYTANIEIRFVAMGNSEVRFVATGDSDV